MAEGLPRLAEYTKAITVDLTMTNLTRLLHAMLNIIRKSQMGMEIIFFDQRYNLSQGSIINAKS